MERDGFLDRLDFELACAAALGFIKLNNVQITEESLQFCDADGRPRASRSGWLDGEDLLAAATREYLAGMRTGFSVRENPDDSSENPALCQAVLARALGWTLLVERGLLEKAEQAGLTVIDPALGAPTVRHPNPEHPQIPPEFFRIAWV